jgi:hypothetical protein
MTERRTHEHKSSARNEHEHAHQFGPIELSRFAGTPHRKCTVPGCKVVSLDLDESE